MAVGYGVPCPKPEKGRDRIAAKRKRERESAAFRKAVRDRDQMQCRLCGRRVVCTTDTLRDDAAHVHHVRGRRVAPEDRYNPAAALLLCGRCHLAQHGQPR